MAQGSSPTNTSATGGPLSPSSPKPPTDLDLDKVVQALVVQLTGLDPTNVRERWQPQNAENDAEPRIPDNSVDWCALGVTVTQADNSPAQVHAGTGDGSTTLVTHETITVECSFYGPSGDAYATGFRDGLHIAQNRWYLLRLGMNLYDVGDVRRLPEVQSMRTLRRSDVTLRLRRRVERVYPILNIKSIHGDIVVGTGTVQAPAARTEPFQTPEN